MIEAGSIKVPENRVAVIIGKNGSVRNQIEQMGDVKIFIDSENNTVTVYQKKDPLKALLAFNVVQAIARGFNPEKAMILFEENMQFIVISIKEFTNGNTKRATELKGRIIGREGRTRDIIETLTGTYISVMGNTVSIIGDYISIQYSREAINMLLQGRKHKTVYSYLEKNAGELKFRKMEESF
ncbi:KH domain-containing protein [Acidiplasma aeolicum]|uniref:KH domain-containing protein n=1 Tax=Acidiplasma aeolicum TaxID=507754 RepID=UPI0037102451